MPIRPIIIRDSLVYIPVAKCAHRSIMRALNDAKVPQKIVDWDELPNLPKVVMLREPMQRAISSYSMFKEQGDLDISFDACMKTWFNGHKPARTIPYDDIHFSTQWHEMGGMVPSYLVKWNFGELAEILGIPNNFGRLGVSTKDNEYLLELDTLDKFNRYYKQDIDMWSG